MNLEICAHGQLKLYDQVTILPAFPLVRANFTGFYRLDKRSHALAYIPKICQQIVDADNGKRNQTPN